MALKLNTSQFNLLFGNAQLIDTRFPEKVSAKKDTSLPLDNAPPSDTAYCLRVGAEMPVAVKWTWNYGSWSESGVMTPSDIIDLMNQGKEVYAQLDPHSPATRILRCTPLTEREAYRIIAKKNSPGALLPSGGIITDGHSAVYDKAADKWLTVSELAAGYPLPYLGVHLTAQPCESELYELELAAATDVYLPGQLKPTHSKFAVLELPLETFRALKTFDLLPLRPTLTRKLTSIPTMNIDFDLIGLVPLNDSENPTSRAKNMKLYHVLHWVKKNDLSSTYASSFYYISPVSDIAPHGAIIFLGRAESNGDLSTAEQLDKLKSRLMAEELAPAVYLFNHKQGEVQQREGITITAPCRPCSVNPLELLDTLPTRELYTYHTPWFARDHLDKLTQVAYEHLSFSLSEYKGIFSPGERI